VQPATVRPVRGKVAAALGLSAVAVALVPAATAGPAPAPDPYPWGKRIDTAADYAKKRSGVVSFAVVDEDGQLRGRNVNRRHYSASVVKVMLMVAYLRQREVKNRALRRSDKRLLEPMIKRSDNESATRIRDQVGNDALRRVARDAEMKNFETDPVWGLSEITASDQARFLFDIEDTIPERHEHYALNLLTKIVSSQRWGIPPAKPRGWEIHFKGGWSPEGGGPDWRVNQVALLRNEGRFSLAVLTKGDPSFDYGKATIRGMARRLLRDYNRYDG
jgi:hypothetical protein